MHKGDLVPLGLPAARRLHKMGDVPGLSLTRANTFTGLSSPSPPCAWSRCKSIPPLVGFCSQGVPVGDRWLPHPSVSLLKEGHGAQGRGGGARCCGILPGTISRNIEYGWFCKENLGVCLLAASFLPNLDGCEQGAFKRILNQMKTKSPAGISPLNFHWIKI